MPEVKLAEAHLVTPCHPETLNGNSYKEFRFPVVNCIFNKRGQSEGLWVCPYRLMTTRLSEVSIS